MNQLSGRVKDGQKCPADVLHMNERPPWSAVACDQDLAGRVRKPDQVVHHQIGTKTGGNTVGSRIAQVMGLKFLSARLEISRSARTVDSPYGVTGLKDASSVGKSAPAANPYKLHEDEKRNRSTPAILTSSAYRTEARWLISYVKFGVRLLNGSFDRAAR